MKNLPKASSIGIILVLVALNIYIFLMSMTVSAKIESYEAKISTLKLANIDLENQAYERGSLEYTSSAAAYMDFVPTAKTMVIHAPGVAQIPAK